jgi:hypothetical protein
MYILCKRSQADNDVNGWKQMCRVCLVRVAFIVPFYLCVRYIYMVYMCDNICMQIITLYHQRKLNYNTITLTKEIIYVSFLKQFRVMSESFIPSRRDHGENVVTRKSANDHVSFDPFANGSFALIHSWRDKNAKYVLWFLYKGIKTMIPGRFG